jgi:hypothetical protein
VAAVPIASQTKIIKKTNKEHVPLGYHWKDLFLVSLGN